MDKRVLEMGFIFEERYLSDSVFRCGCLGLYSVSTESNPFGGSAGIISYNRDEF